MAKYENVSKVAPTRLGPSSPLGYFRTLDPQARATEFWIVEREEKRFAIILKADDSKWLFEAFPLDSDDTAWTGISLGPVEVQVDLETGAFSDSIRPSRGAISVAGGRAYISAAPSGHMGSRITFEVGQGGPNSMDAAATFSGWRLIQRDHAGAAIVLFEKT